MSSLDHDRLSGARLWLRYGVVWLLLILLLGITLGTAYLDLGDKGAILHLGIAGLQVLLVWLLFMNLWGSSSIVRICAMSGLLWLTFLFALVFSDYFTRPWNGGGTSLAQHRAPEGTRSQSASPRPTLPLDETK